MHRLFCRMFYFYFESCNNENDLFVIWLTRGLGCSSELALFYEHGPFKIGDKHDSCLERGSSYIFVKRDIRYDEQGYVDKEFGTRVLRITVGHDHNDYLLARKLGIPILNVMNKYETLNEPLLSKQWFVIMAPLAEKALDIVKKDNYGAAVATGSVFGIL
ncbi:hypothetical protein LXL04_003074 [Taraxacum kok-saghyz]